MSSTNFVINYKPCNKCNKLLARADESYCKSCKPIKLTKRAIIKSLSKKYLINFDIKSTSYSKEPSELTVSSGIYIIITH
jgi:phage FluMu protein Com